MAVTAWALNFICGRKINIYRDKQSVFYRKRILISLFTLILGVSAVALPFLLKRSRYSSDLLGTACVVSAILGIMTVVTSFVNMPAMKGYPKVELTGEDAAFFRYAFTDVFSRILKYSNEAIARLEKEAAGVPKHRVKYMFRCVGYFLKRLFFNSLFSRSTGTDPMYLDSGVDGFIKYGRHMLREPVHLACSAAQELKAGAEKALEQLREVDTDGFREMIAGCFAAYKGLKNEKVSIPENSACHAGEIAFIMACYLWTMQGKTLNKINVLYRKNVKLGIPVNIYRELVTIIECRKWEQIDC